MKRQMTDQLFTGERALFQETNLMVQDSIFDDGESPLKESSNIEINHSIFKWKYPLWYCDGIILKDSIFSEMGRAGIWYTNNLTVTNCLIKAPKTFRKVDGASITNVDILDASETLWNCKNITINHTTAKGDYFAMNTQKMEIDHLNLVGNYSFDGAKDVVIRHSKLLSKDAFWNSENVTVYDSFISGEYLGWNAKNLTLINCTIESLQGLCYVENLIMKECKLINTTLAFEYSTVDVQINGKIDSICNPSSGTINADEIGEIILDDKKIDPSNTKIILQRLEVS